MKDTTHQSEAYLSGWNDGSAAAVGDNPTGPTSDDPEYLQGYNEAFEANSEPEEQEGPDDEDYLREIAMEAGMLHGINAYNEVMGWDTSEPEDDDRW